MENSESNYGNRQKNLSNNQKNIYISDSDRKAIRDFSLQKDGSKYAYTTKEMLEIIKPFANIEYNDLNNLVNHYRNPATSDNNKSKYDYAEEVLRDVFGNHSREISNWSSFSDAIRFGRIKINIIQHSEVFDKVVFNQDNKIFFRYSSYILALIIIVFTFYSLLSSPFWNMVIVAVYFYLIKTIDIILWHKRMFSITISIVLILLINFLFNIDILNNWFMVFILIGRILLSSIYNSFITDAMRNDPNIFLYLVENDKMTSIYDKQINKEYYLL